MPSRDAEPQTDGQADQRGRLRAYLTRFFTSWVAEDPNPTYSSLDLADGLGQDHDPVCQPCVQVPESAEVSQQARTPGRPDAAMAVRRGR